MAKMLDGIVEANPVAARPAATLPKKDLLFMMMVLLYKLKMMLSFTDAKRYVLNHDLPKCCKNMILYKTIL
jgi:hypothetical protein